MTTNKDHGRTVRDNNEDTGTTPADRSKERLREYLDRYYGTRYKRLATAALWHVGGRLIRLGAQASVWLIRRASR